MLRYFPLLPLAAFVMTAAPVHAYIDPGSGSVAVQVILAGFLGFLLALKIYWKKIINLFRKDEKTEKENQR
jgi:hypothetical protein